MNIHKAKELMMGSNWGLRQQRFRLSTGRWALACLLVFCVVTGSLPGTSTSANAQEQQGDFEINSGLNDAWFNPSTAGQGIMITVFPDIGQMFLAWFTYDTDRPDASVIANLGEPGHRWLTAFGPYNGDTAELDVTITSGGVFDSAQPPVNQVTGGTITIQFADCENALLSYDLTSVSMQGDIPLSRVALDNVPLCDAAIAPEPVVLTHLGNLGVLIQYEDKEVIIDGLLGNVGGWVTPDTNELNEIVSGNPPYDDIEVAAYTHGHGDHVDFSVVNNFLTNQPNTLFIGATTEGVGSINNQSRVQKADMARFANQQFDINGVAVTVYHTRHFNQFGNDFSGVTNLAYLVELGGKKILHVGDFDYAADNIAALGLQPGDLDVIIMPTFNTLISQANFNLITSMLAPKHIVAAHFRGPFLVSERGQVLGLLPDVIIFDKANEQFTIE